MTTSSDDLVKTITPLFRETITPLFREVNDAVRKFNSAADTLSKSGLEKFTEQLKTTLKASKLFEDAILDNAKTAKDLSSVLNDLESKYEDIAKLEDKVRVRTERYIKDQEKIGQTDKQKAQIALTALDIAKKSLAKEYEKLGLTEDQIKALKESYPAVKAEIASRYANIAATDKSTKMLEGFGASLKTSVSSFFAFKTAAEHATKAISIAYEQATRLSSKGMLGAMTAINSLTWKILMSAKDFEDILNKNRGLVNALGGGVVGIQKFGDEIARTSSDLAYLGKDAGKAAASFMEVSARAGLNIKKDFVAYEKNRKSMVKQFGEIHDLYGDSAEEYTSVIDQLNTEESTRNRLNTLNSKELVLAQAEIQARYAGLKAMGLTNDQVIAFGKTVDSSTIKGDYSERAAEANRAKQSYQAKIDSLQGGDADQKSAAAEMIKHKAEFERMTDLWGQQRKQEFETMKMTNGAAALRAEAVGSAALQQAPKGSSEAERAQWSQKQAVPVMLESQTQRFTAETRPQGNASATARAQGFNNDDKSPAELAQLKQNATVGGARDSPEAKALAASALLRESLNRTLDTPLAQVGLALSAFVGALFIATTALGKFSMMADKGGSLPGGDEGVKGGKGGKGGKFGKGAKLGVAGLVGGVALDYAGDALTNNGHEKLGATADIAGSALSGASIGAVLGMGPIGAAVGGALGAGYGLYKNWGTLSAPSAATQQQQSQPSKSDLQSHGPAQSSTTSSTPSGVPLTGTAGSAMAYLQQKGWTREQAAGMAANLQSESNFNPGAVGDGGKAYGIGQWHPDRQAEFQKLFGRPIQGSTLQQQLDFMNYEITSGKESSAGNRLRNAKSAAEAGSIVSQYYERPADRMGEANKRGQLASSMFSSSSSDQSMNPPFTGASSSQLSPVGSAVMTGGAADLQSSAGGAGAATTASVAGSTGSALDELKKQTGLLNDLVKNTTNSGKLSANASSYLQDSSHVVKRVT